MDLYLHARESKEGLTLAHLQSWLYTCGCVHVRLHREGY